eukprot:6484449-Amphidinium_carterae.1
MTLEICRRRGSLTSPSTCPSGLQSSAALLLPCHLIHTFVDHSRQHVNCDLPALVLRVLGVRRTDGSIWVVGGNMRMTDNKGNTKSRMHSGSFAQELPQPKKGM